MTRTEVLNKLMTTSLDYFMQARFSRVSALSYQSVLAAVKSKDTAYVLGYIDSTMNAIELLAPPAEANTLVMVLQATKALLDPTVSIEHSGASMALFELGRLVA